MNNNDLIDMMRDNQKASIVVDSFKRTVVERIREAQIPDNDAFAISAVIAMTVSANKLYHDKYGKDSSILKQATVIAQQEMIKLMIDKTVASSMVKVG